MLLSSAPILNDHRGRSEPNPWQVTGEAVIEASGESRVLPVYPRRVFKGESDHEHLVVYLPRAFRRGAGFSFRIALHAPRRPDLMLEGQAGAAAWHLVCACTAASYCHP